MISADRLVLDTSAYSHLRAGHTGVLDCVADASVVVVPAVVLGELAAGFTLGRRAEENRRVRRAMRFDAIGVEAPRKLGGEVLDKGRAEVRVVKQLHTAEKPANLRSRAAANPSAARISWHSSLGKS